MRTVGNSGTHGFFAALTARELAMSLAWKETGRSDSFTYPLQSQSSAVADPIGRTLSLSSMFVTFTAEGTGSLSMLLTEQGACSDAMAVSCGSWNQSIKKERNNQFTNHEGQLLKYSK